MNRHHDTDMKQRAMIRRAESRDLAAIQSIARDAYTLYIERIGRRPAPMDADYTALISSNAVFIGEDQGVIQGFIVIYPVDGALHIETVAVRPDFQGKGLGKALLAFAEKNARDGDLAFLDLYTNAKMTENIAFYPKLGYVEYDRRLEAGFERVFFRKAL